MAARPRDRRHVPAGHPRRGPAPGAQRVPASWTCAHAADPLVRNVGRRQLAVHPGGRRGTVPAAPDVPGGVRLELGQVGGDVAIAVPRQHLDQAGDVRCLRSLRVPRDARRIHRRPGGDDVCGRVHDRCDTVGGDRVRSAAQRHRSVDRRHRLHDDRLHRRPPGADEGCQHAAVRRPAAIDGGRGGSGGARAAGGSSAGQAAPGTETVATTYTVAFALLRLVGLLASVSALRLHPSAGDVLRGPRRGPHRSDLGGATLAPVRGGSEAR